VKRSTDTFGRSVSDDRAVNANIIGTAIISSLPASPLTLNLLTINAEATLKEIVHRRNPRDKFIAKKSVLSFYVLFIAWWRSERLRGGGEGGKLRPLG
jgi:hypothetical protein